MNDLCERLPFEKADAYLLTSDSARTYASGFVSSAGFIIVTKNGVFAALDFRYYEMAQRFLAKKPRFTLLPLKNTIDDNLRDFVKEHAIKVLGIEEDTLPVGRYEKIKTYLAEYKTELVPAAEDIWITRAVKTPEEIEKINTAQRLTESAFDYFLSILRPGVSERDIVFEVEKYISINDGGLSFGTIGVSGPNSSLVHGVPSDRIIEKGDAFLLDFGAKVDNYCSDMTRTVSLGNPGDEFREIYGIVLEANTEAIKAVRTGMTGRELDAVARTIIENHGIKDNFAHGLGHGIGTECHESPIVGPRSKDIIKDMQIFTIEPGVYLAGKFGVRIEDMVFMKDGKAQVITKTPKNLIVL